MTLKTLHLMDPPFRSALRRLGTTGSSMMLPTVSGALGDFRGSGFRDLDGFRI